MGNIASEVKIRFVSTLLFWFQNTKVVLLEDLAAHFNIRTQDAINRVQVLQEMGRLTGNIVCSLQIRRITGAEESGTCARIKSKQFDHCMA